ncbi:hypothetical protein ACFO3D_18220 [Virgibacillus kekensis]|uniref:Lipoprotein n=1 Tax=Virgibacillus kekensis TaxID=202261 RepID=A0ABV9DR97_9BACI
MRKVLLILFSIVFLAIGSGCTGQQGGATTISANPDSNYVKTFKDLELGILYDFKFNLENAKEKWVNVWVERYTDGKKDSNPLVDLSYGMSPRDSLTGHLGFGIINPNSDSTMVFLYAPGVKSHPILLAQPFPKNHPRTWGYSIGDEEVELEPEKTKVLGVYRQSSSKNSIRGYNMKDPEAIKQMIKNDKVVLLLKIKVEDRRKSDETT